MGLINSIGIGIGRRRSRGGAFWTPPFKADALFGLDGTIITIGSDKYFKDKSPNGRNFLITGYDFDSTWVKGFPYKSAATISAPAGDAVLIAADINSFLYTSGTPNAIPVSSLFQDVSYDHIIFCKHSAQVLDGNGVETYEPRVSEIVMYVTVKAGANLTTCQTYYSVPVEATSNVVWVSKAGNDTSGNGTKALPYLTISKAYNAVTGNTVYVKSGIYTENYSSLGVLYLNTGHTNNIIQCIGLVTIKGTSVSYGVLWSVQSAGSVATVNNGILDEEVHAYNTIQFNTAACTLTTNNIYFKGIKTNLVNVSTVGTLVLNKCIATETTRKYITGSKAVTINNSYLVNICTSVANTLTFLNNKLINNVNGHVVININLPLIAKGNYIKSNGNGINCVAGAAADPQSISITYNYFYIEDLTGAGVPCGVYAGGTGSKYVLSILNNKFNQTKTGALTSTSGNGIYIIDQVAPEILNNIFDFKTTSLCDAIVHKFGGTVVSSVNKINYNKVFSESLTGVGITIGYENGYANIADGSEIIGNYIQGYKKNNPSGNGSIHGILTNCGKNMIIKYNHSSYCAVGIVAKTGIQDTYTSGGVTYNICEDNQSNIWARGIAGMNIFNNTIVHKNVVYTNTFIYGIACDENSAIAGNQYCENIIIKNNIIISEIITGCLIYFDAHALANGCTADYNIYYSTYAKPFYAGGEKTWAEWQAFGYDAHSVMLTTMAQVRALFTDYDNGDYSLKAGSQAIGTGQAQDAAYDDGLDASTNYGSSTAIPVIVTKQQSANWDIGAYIH